MKALQELGKNQVEILFTDIDDTLTNEGRLHAKSYDSLWKLHDMGISVVPITGRPAGWCEMIARQWPVAAVIGENGAFYFSYDQNSKKMKRFFVQQESERKINRQKLDAIEKEILRLVPGAALASDQFTRLFDLAIDFCEDVPPLAKEQIQAIKKIFEKHGATAKISSIHVNGWFGDYNKASTCLTYLKKETSVDPSKMQSACCFCGDSPNDEPLFQQFELSFGVANIKEFADQLKHEPQYVSQKKGGFGFAEIAERIMATRTS